MRNRLLVLTAIAFFAVAGTASASTPMRIVADPGSKITIEDEENIMFESNEVQTWGMAGHVFGYLGSGYGVFNHKYARCAGGEVRAELIIDAYRWSNTNTANVTAHIDLYEGASCSTMDFDGQSEYREFTMKIGDVKKMTFAVRNTNEDDEDRADAVVIFRGVAA